MVDVLPLPEQVSVDPDDDRVLACAVSGKAEVIVSGDDDLLRLKTFSGIPFMKPAEFLENLKQND